jgi:outer membrane lipoprotein-sorting protein
MYQKRRDQSQSVVEGYHKVTFDSYDPVTNTVYVIPPSKDWDPSELEDDLRDDLDNQTVVGLIDPSPPEKLIE